MVQHPEHDRGPDPAAGNTRGRGRASTAGSGRERIASERAEAREKAERVGQLANKLAVAESRLHDLSVRVETKREATNKARVDLRRARRAYQRARQAVAASAERAEAAAGRVEHHRKRLDAFVAGSYKQGRRIGSLPSFLNAESPQEMLERASLLDVISRKQLDVLDDLRRARTRKANVDSVARQAAQRAEAKRVAAERARAAAESAKDAAVALQKTQRARADELRKEKAHLAAELERARANVGELRQQRRRHQQWVADRRAQEQDATAQDTPANEAPGAARAPSTAESSGADTTNSARAPSAVNTVVQRARSQLGVTYAWGGGNAHGPTKGVHDGGVADAHGDYRKIGFDCSGLMVYAFSGVGIDLPHYSGYQYRAGERVPLSQMRRGDMLFWQDGGNVHHVALYVGNGRMIEAPYSGAHVRVTSVRYDGIAPYAVRML